MNTVYYFDRRHPAYPQSLTRHLGSHAPAALAARGNVALWQRPSPPVTALVSSAAVPAGILLALHDIAQAWRTAPFTIISGFHSPPEQEALTVLLRGACPLIICPARGLEKMRVKAVLKKPLAAGWVLLLSPFGASVRRATAETAQWRNRVVAALADRILIAHARRGGKTESLAREIIGWGKPVFTIEHPANANLVALGAKYYKEINS